MTRNGHVRFGERGRETRLSQGRKVRSAPTLLSPLLANIYLDRLDKYVEQELIPEYTKGERRKRNLAYQRLGNAIHRLRKQGRTKEAKLLRQQMQQLPSLDPEDPDFRRLKYVRYADDVRHLTQDEILLAEKRGSEEDDLWVTLPT